MSGTRDYLRVGVIFGVHGLKGRLKVRIITDFPERLAVAQTVFIHIDNAYSGYRVKELIPTGPSTCFLGLADVDDRTRAEGLVGGELCIEKTEAARTREDLLDEESYYYYELIGCRVEYRGGPFGEVADILEAGAGEVLVIRGAGGKEYLIPFVQSMVETSRVTEGVITITPVEGVLDI